MDSQFIFEQIGNNSKVYLSSSRFWTPPLSSSSTSSLPSRSREYNLKNFDRFRISYPQAFYANTSVSVADRPAWKQIFMANLCSFPPFMTYKEN